MVDDHGLAVPGKGSNCGINCPTQGCHANLYRWLLDVPIFSRFHPSKGVKLDMQMMLLQIFTQIFGEGTFSRATGAIQNNDASFGAKRLHKSLVYSVTVKEIPAHVHKYTDEEILKRLNEAPSQGAAAAGMLHGVSAAKSSAVMASGSFLNSQTR